MERKILEFKISDCNIPELKILEYEIPGYYAVPLECYSHYSYLDRNNPE